MTFVGTSYRKTDQFLLGPEHEPPAPEGQYDIYPVFPITSGQIERGFAALAKRLASESRIVIDGYGGVLWPLLQEKLNAALLAEGVHVKWVDVSTAMLPEETILSRIQPYLGGDDPVFGKRFDGQLIDFFDPTALAQLAAQSDTQIIFYGTGAALVDDKAFLVFVDVPKNEIQFRSRARMITNLGAAQPASAKAMYKRFYFVDWVALNQHKCALLPKIKLIVDAQRADDPTFMSGDALRNGLQKLSQNYFRVRPWFEPGVWGGQWLKERIPQLPQNVENYAWSFELITPENGLIFSDGRYRLEISFDFLMYQEYTAVLGRCAERFRFEFPIRFDFLDTWDGGNLSVQCHPRPDYIRQHFGENFTQDETYYILDCKPGARVYLGFQEDIDAHVFRHALETSLKDVVPVDIDRFVNSEPAHKHDLFLIPNGTIHCSGKDILVLEISATPYIFTFKMYDWMRLDLDGMPRPLNIERAFDNLCFERKGLRVRDELVAKPNIIESGTGWRVVHLPTHPEHFYDVHRLEFESEIHVETNGSPHVLSLVEGRSVILETHHGMRQRFNYAETFVLPAAAERYRLINQGQTQAKVVKAFMK
ncbi:MAG: class I mannose-6-phosphate isomerase [Aggregatilineales bacterium]